MSEKLTIKETMTALEATFRNNLEEPYDSQDIINYFNNLLQNLRQRQEVKELELVQLQEKYEARGRLLRVCGIKVARFAGLHDKVKNGVGQAEDHGRADPYYPEGIPGLIDDLLILMQHKINEIASGKTNV